MDHDLAGLLENERVKLQPSQIKLYMKQLLEGTEYMHRVRLPSFSDSKCEILTAVTGQNHILHRDMKAANLLISNDGSLRIADFGLARAYLPESRGGKDGKDRKYTNCVVTRWYRPPELLLGARHYGGEVDIWGIGYVPFHSYSVCTYGRCVDVSLARCSCGNPFYLEQLIQTSSRRFGHYAGHPINILGPTMTIYPGARGSRDLQLHIQGG